MSTQSVWSVGLWTSALLTTVFPTWGLGEEIRSDTTPRTVLKLPTPELNDEQIPADHPLFPVIQLASDAYKRMQSEVRDYTCVMVRRERVDGRLRPHEFIYAKVRHRQVENNRVVAPFSLYLKFLKPASVSGREVLYVEGENNGEMFARRGGTRFAFVTTRLHPDSDLAMRGNRYPITEFGIENLLYRLLESAHRDLQSPCQVNILQDAKVNSRPALGVIVRHPSPAEGLGFYEARIFVDKELGLPVHYESYDWPEKLDAEPELMEQYSYTQLQLNRGLTDADFSEDNPQYHVK